MFLKSTVAFLSLSLAVVLAGCGQEEPIPATPTYAEDVQPILIARCVRCHGAGDMLNGDPVTTGSAGKSAPPRGYFQYLEDRDCPGATCKQGARFYATTGKGAMNAYLALGSDSNDRMPPPPAPPLTDRELEILKRWFNLPDPQ